MYESEQIFAYEKKGNSATIWRCFSRDTKAEIPEYVEGCLVTEVAPYAFSAHMAADEIERGLASGRLHLYSPEIYRGMENEFPALCGEALEEVVFPAALRRVGRYCFYNCARLHEISFGGVLSDWGSGVFTGCHQMRLLRVCTDPEGNSGLKDVLDELPEALEVEYYRPGLIKDQENTGARLVFPGFYEEGVENTPARILETRIHGSGLRYRNCFRNRKFDFHQYDALFVHAKAQEKPELAARLAMNRLRFPLELTEDAEKRYEEYVCAHETELSQLLLTAQDLEGIRWLLKLTQSRAGGEGIAPLLDELTEKAAKRHLTEILSFLMDYRRRNASPARRKKRLEL